MTDTPPTTTLPYDPLGFDASIPSTPGSDTPGNVSDTPPTPADAYNLDFQPYVPFAEREEFRSYPSPITRDPVGGTPRGGATIDRGAIRDRVSNLQLAMTMMRSGGANAEIIKSTLGPEVYDDLTGQYIVQDVNASSGTTTSRPLFNGGYEEYGYEFQAGNQRRSGSSGFDPTRAGAPRAAYGSQGPLNEFDGMTLHEVRAAYFGLNPQTQEELKGMLWQAGYYDGRDQNGNNVSGTPTWDSPDPRDVPVFLKFMDDNMGQPNLSMNQIMDQKISSRFERNLGDYLDSANNGTRGGGTPRAGHVYQRSDPNTLRDSLELLSKQELGMALDPKVMENIVNEALGKEHSSQARNFAARDAASASSANSVAPSGTRLSDIDAFLAAVGQDYEGGKVQIAPADWSKWANRVGMDPTTPRTMDNQQEVARRYVDMSLANGGNFRDAASSWLAGPGSDAGLGGGVSMNDYARTALDRMVQGQSTLFGPASDPGRGPDVTIQNYDLNSDLRRQLLAKNATDVQTWKYANRGSDFFDLLSQGSTI